MIGKVESRIVVLVGLMSVVACWPPSVEAADTEPNAQAILGQLESLKGICAIVGDTQADLAVDLARASELVVYVQLDDAGAVDTARQAAEAAGLLNSRVYVEQGDYDCVHLADNLADAVVLCGETASRVAEQEVLRVVRPGGKAFIGQRVVVKPVPKGMDDWSHPYHGPDNNPQSTDQIARAPYRTQFLAEPWYCPMPEVTVVSGGRVFKAFGNRAFRRPQWPMLSKLVAINGYNGTNLWTRDLDPDFMIHRNTMIATPETLYLADATSCKLFDAATGDLQDEIKVPDGLSDGPVWKWMALEGDTLYALVGEKEPAGDALKGPAFRGAGWPWWEIPDYAWGFGRTMLAVDVKTKKVLWHHREDEPLDTRAMTMRNGRIYFFSHEKFIGCLDAEKGEVIWKTSDPETLAAIGQRRPAQRAVWGFASSAFAKCTDDAIYFAGPQQERLVAVSTRDGKLLWQYPKEGNFQLVLRDDVLYAMGSSHPSRKLDPLTGEMLLQLPSRAACTRATGSVDRVFVRGRGTRCWDVATDQWRHISPMRPACHDGVVVAGGHLYWGPWMCGCNLSLIGVIGLGPAGDFDYSMKAVDSERREVPANAAANVAPFEQTPDDWATYRKDNVRSSQSEQSVAEAVKLQWEYVPKNSYTCTAPVTVGESVFVAGSDGVVRALDADGGKLVWSAYTGGAIRVPPAIADGRALVGSADGYVYAFEAASGRPLWRFRAAPIEQKIAVYGSLGSTWPVGSGVLVAAGVAYTAAGIANYDGTHVYALDAATGAIRWQNSTSGNTDGGQGAGVSLQGDLLLHDSKLYVAGGNRIALASYETADGTFQAARAPKVGFDRRGPRGHDLFLRHDGTVAVSGSLPMYGRSEDIHYIEYAELKCSLGDVMVITNGVGLLPPGQISQTPPKPVWAARPFNENVAVAVAKNAVIVMGINRQFADRQAPPEETYGITALDIRTGKQIWQQAISAAPVAWGLAIDREGRVLATLQDGHVLCLGPDA